jgi:hypothetical protein
MAAVKGCKIGEIMDKRKFNQTWETEYIKVRVDRVTEAVNRESYESALDYLSMIQDKTKAAERLIRAELNKK